MGRILKKGAIFLFVISCSLYLVNSSSGISQFSANRKVDMKVVESEDAFISLPEIIEVDVKVLQTTTNYYKLSPELNVNQDKVEDEKENQDEEIVFIDIIVPKGEPKLETISLVEHEEELDHQAKPEVKAELKKDILKTETVAEVMEVISNLKIKNNMFDVLTLEGINFDNLMLGVNPEMRTPQRYSTFNPVLRSGGIIDIPIAYSIDESLYTNKLDTNSFNITDHGSKATLYFKWNSGESTIYKDVRINITIEEKLEEIEVKDEIEGGT